MTAERRVLLVTYHFPPDPEVGSLRGEKFVKYLPDFGWRPDVLTVEPRCYGLPAASLVPGVERTAVWPSLSSMYVATRRRLARRPRARTGDDRPFDAKDAVAPGPASWAKRLALSLASWPDNAIGWWLPAVLAGRRLVRRERYDALITTSPPHTAHLVGLALFRPGVRWIVDLRDPWAGSAGKPQSLRSALSDALDRWSERAILTRAAAVIVGTERFRMELVRRYPELGRRVHQIPAGIDADDFEGISRVPARKFTVAHVGQLYYRRSPEPLFVGLHALVREGAIPRDDLEVVLAGGITDGIDAVGLAQRYGLADLLRLPGQLPRREALELMASAGALLLLAQAQPLQIPAKTFEYLAAGPPIIAVTGDGATSDLIRETRAGWVIAREDERGMGAALLGAYRDWRRRLEGAVDGRPAPGSRFDRRELTGQLAALLDGAGP